jgi:hypothetical protein
MNLEDAKKPPACGHYEAQYGCHNCKERTRALLPEFPLQVDRNYPRPGPITAPWSVAEKAWAVYAGKHGTQQSVERLAQRGGFAWSEMDFFYPAWREETDELLKLRGQLQSVEELNKAALALLAEAVQAGAFQAECPHGAEPDYCDGCAHAREKASAEVRRKARALLQAASLL